MSSCSSKINIIRNRNQCGGWLNYNFTHTHTHTQFFSFFEKKRTQKPNKQELIFFFVCVCRFPACVPKMKRSREAHIEHCIEHIGPIEHFAHHHPATIDLLRQMNAQSLAELEVFVYAFVHVDKRVDSSIADDCIMIWKRLYLFCEGDVDLFYKDHMSYLVRTLPLNRRMIFAVEMRNFLLSHTPQKPLRTTAADACSGDMCDLPHCICVIVQNSRVRKHDVSAEDVLPYFLTRCKLREKSRPKKRISHVFSDTDNDSVDNDEPSLSLPFSQCDTQEQNES